MVPVSTSRRPESILEFMLQNWNCKLTQQLASPVFAELDKVFGLSELTAWPNARGLNLLREKLEVMPDIEFVCQNDCLQEEEYYEQIIYRQKRIPTRPDNWHDLFNGLIWLLFPQTKSLLNRQHMEDIQTFGLSPRSKRRNHITHFDECGIILAYQDDAMPGLLADHQWRQAFVDNRGQWGNGIDAFVFGHANLEMLLEPFSGLTGKWLAVKTTANFTRLPYLEQVRHLDDVLAARLESEDTLARDRVLKPLPLLGIPGWWEANREPAFYDNQEYFRPKRTGTRT